jgi:hypothetical protein
MFIENIMLVSLRTSCLHLVNVIENIMLASISLHLLMSLRTSCLHTYLSKWLCSHKESSILSPPLSPISEGLQHCNRLQTLDLDINAICLKILERNGIDNDGAQALAEGLQH